MSQATAGRWTTDDASELYEVPRWANGYFSVGAGGHMRVHPEKDPERAIDLKELVDLAQQRGLRLPVLLRFNGILENRLREIHGAFGRAIEEHDYAGRYICVYPIKVNQQRQVVEEIVKHGGELGFGLEAGSKPELLAAIALGEATTPIICNGFKDAEFIQMTLMGQRIGRSVTPIVEKYTELSLILEAARRLDVRPRFGARVKLAAQGAGRWKHSAGYRSKFGLTITEVLRLVEELRQREMLDCLKLLHFHLGSQVTNIRHVKSAVVEAARVYAELVQRGVGLESLNVGGGLGVDYDGSQTDFASSVNYTLQEYANDIVHHVQTVCDDAGVPHPNLVSESGRALVAYHSVLVFPVLGVSQQGENGGPGEAPDESVEQPLRDLWDTSQRLNVRNVLESFHDAQQALETAINLFNAGYLPLDQRRGAENLYFAICRRIRKLVGELEFMPEELQDLDRMLADTYFCNFSIFQSLPDHWAIGQLFPIVPIHRLEQRPTRQAVLGDITCDSDGRMDQFIDRRDIKRTLPLHSFDGSPYYLAAFLVGAYQEILGDLHNLFGDTDAVHVTLTPTGETQLETFVQGESVSEVLRYVQFDERDLIRRLQTAMDAAVREGRIGHDLAGRFARFYERTLRGYTYLVEPEPPAKIHDRSELASLSAAE